MEWANQRPGRPAEGPHAWGLILLEWDLRWTDPKGWPRPYKLGFLLEAWILPALGRMGVSANEWGKLLEGIRNREQCGFVKVAEWLDNRIRSKLGERINGEPIETCAVNVVVDQLEQHETRSAARGQDSPRHYIRNIAQRWDPIWAEALTRILKSPVFHDTPTLPLVCAGLPPGFEMNLRFLQAQTPHDPKAPEGAVGVPLPSLQRHLPRPLRPHHQRPGAPGGPIYPAGSSPAMR